MDEEGLEPSRMLFHSILSAARIPIPPLVLIKFWRRRWDLHPRMGVLQTPALATSPRRRYFAYFATSFRAESIVPL